MLGKKSHQKYLKTKIYSVRIIKMISKNMIQNYQANGAVLLKGIFTDWVSNLRSGIDKLMKKPSPLERSYAPSDGSAIFFQDFCNWQRFEEFNRFVKNSQMAEIASCLMQSKISRFFHDHVLVKEPGSSIITPWHQDQSYYCINGLKNVSFWIPLDQIDKKTSLKCIAGSHLWGKNFKPKRFNGEDLYENDTSEEMHDIEKNIKNYKILSWDLKPGDAIAFNFSVIHGASRNYNIRLRRRIFSARWVGDDCTFLDRKGKGSPPFKHLKLKTGDSLDIREFPVIYSNIV